VTSENGTAGNPYTLQFIVALSPLYGWQATVNSDDLVSTVYLNNTSPASDGVFLLPYTAAFDTADIEISISDGAVIVPPLTSIPVQLGDTGSTLNYSFSVRPEIGGKGVMSNYTIRFRLALSSDNSWEALVDTPDGQESDLFSDTAVADDGVFSMDSSVTGLDAKILFTLPDKATLFPPNLNLDLNPSFTLASGRQDVSFQVMAEDGTLSEVYTVSFQVTSTTCWDGRER
jgi:hypothetical protein